MRLRRLLRRIRRRHPQRHRALFDLPTQRIQQIRATVVLEHPGHVERNLPLAVAPPAAHAGETPAVAHRAHRQLVLHRPVRQRVHALRHHRAYLVRDIVAARHHDIRAQITHQLLVFRRSVADHPQTVRLGQLHHITAVAARRPRHRNRLPRRKRQLVEREPRRQRVHRQRRRLRVARPRRRAADRIRLQHDALPVRPVAPAGNHHRHHRVAHRQVGLRPLADLVHHARRIHPRDVRRRPRRPQRIGARAAAHKRIRRIHRRRMHPQPHLARPRMRLRQLHHLQRLRPAELHHAHASHSHPSQSSRRPIGAAGRSSR